MQEKFGKYLKGDKILWYIIFALAIISIPAVYSAAGTLVFKGSGGTSSFLIRQIKFTSLGLISVFFFHFIPFKFIRKIAKYVLPIALFLLILTMLFGNSTNDAKRWLSIFGLVRIQTSELAKFALILFVARVLATSHNDTKKKDGAYKLVRNSTIITIGLIIPYNLSTGLLLFLSILAILFVAKVQTKKILNLILVVLAIGITYSTLSLAGVPLPGRVHTWKNRIVEYLDNDKEDDNSQSSLAKMAIADGGFTGSKPGNGILKYSLQQAHSDYIYAFIIEEYGIIVGIILLGLYIAIFYRGMQIAKKAERTFPLFLSLGFTLVIVLQAFINMAVAVGIVPVTGQPLPFVSMGGTSMVMTGFAFGVLLNISRNADKKEVKSKEKEQLAE